MIPEAGELDQRATILKKSTVQDAYGDPSTTYVEAGLVWVKLSSLNPKLLDIAKGFASTVQYQALARYTPGATATSQLKVAGVTGCVTGYAAALLGVRPDQ